MSERDQNDHFRSEGDHQEPPELTPYDRVRDPLGYYQVLHVSMDADEEEIYTTYHFLYSLNPPESFPPERRKAAKNAYDVLLDSTRRAAYDPAWLLPENRLQARLGVMYSGYLRRGGTPYSLARPLPLPNWSNKRFGCLRSAVLLAGVVLLFL